MPEKNGISKSTETQIAVILNEVKHITGEVGEIKQSLKDETVKREEFEPVQKLVYALVGLVLTAVIGAVIALVVNQPPL